MKKSLPIAMLQVLVKALQAESCELVCLQIGPDRDDADDLNISWDQALPPDADFFELGQTMKRCDLIITVDTAAAHLAGALGIPAWCCCPGLRQPVGGAISKKPTCIARCACFANSGHETGAASLPRFMQQSASGLLHPSPISSIHDVFHFSPWVKPSGRGNRPPGRQLVSL